jgi:hypothetical protein
MSTSPNKNDVAVNALKQVATNAAEQFVYESVKKLLGLNLPPYSPIVSKKLKEVLAEHFPELKSNSQNALNKFKEFAKDPNSAKKFEDLKKAVQKAFTQSHKIR